MIPSANSPRITICSVGAVPRGHNGYRRLVDEVGAAGLEIDATSWVGAHRPGLPKPAHGADGQWIDAMWLSAAALDRAETRFAEANEPDRSAAFELVIRLHDNASPSEDQLAIVAARRWHDAAGRRFRLAVAVPAVAPEGGRAHLYRLNVVRRLAEEWELGLALDLSPRTDHRWEAEAAMQIVGSRLVAIRIRSSLTDRIAVNSEIHRRALRAAADGVFRGRIVLAPPTPWWLAWRRSSICRDLTANRDVVQRLLFERRVETDVQNRISRL